VPELNALPNTGNISYPTGLPMPDFQVASMEISDPFKLLVANFNAIRILAKHNHFAEHFCLDILTGNSL
jgi:hypothetical protein